VISRTFWIPDQACPVLDTGSGMTEKGFFKDLSTYLKRGYECLTSFGYVARFVYSLPFKVLTERYTLHERPCESRNRSHQTYNKRL